ncbi:MAG: hypothetical protein IJ574_04910 [Bacilli bacterium]|nr:hypothetical protein [Bacilli bacterium]
MKITNNNIQLIKNDLYNGCIEVIVDAIINDTPKSKILVLKSKNDSLPILFPGQYINVYSEIDGIGYIDNFTVFSSLKDAINGEYRIVVKNNKKRKLQKYLYDNIEYQNELLISKPMGDYDFSVMREEENIIAIGYDNDVLPFYALANYLIDNKLDYTLNIIHICPNENNIILKDKFKNLSSYNNNINYEDVILSDENIDEIKKVINKYITEFNSFYISGNVEFYKNINSVISDYNLPRKCLRYKDFTPVVNPNNTNKYKMNIITPTQELELDCYGNESLLKSLLKSCFSKSILINNGLDDNILGEVISGNVEIINSINNHVSNNDGIINLKLSYPCEDVTIKLL